MLGLGASVALRTMAEHQQNAYNVGMSALGNVGMSALGNAEAPPNTLDRMEAELQAWLVDWATTED